LFGVNQVYSKNNKKTSIVPEKWVSKNWECDYNISYLYTVAMVPLIFFH